MGSLTGVTVVDFTRQLPGPFASRELLRLGARVVKVEPPEGDLMPETWYRALNDGKEIVSWDARGEAPPAALAEADVVLEGFRPGVWERLAVDLPATAILCSITGYGATGPRAQDAGHDLNYLAYSGALADTAPALPPVQIADLAAGAQGAVIEVLAALLERARTGLGARIVVSMTHNSHRFVAHRLAGDPVPRLLTGGVACYRIYETADGRYLTVAALEPKFWRNLCALLERPELEDRAFEPELPELAELFRSRPLHDWRTLLEGNDTCVAPVLTLAEAADELE
jgi:crotonobetainyl-CoA:carnitine CoA-transferase CaiB-like acyl-CoA transferase